MSRFENYEPTENDILWILVMLNVIRSGGTLAFPATKLIYKINHVEKTATLVNPEMLDDIHSSLVHRRAITVFEKIGWYVHVQGEGG